jgi:hypothetical protein
MKKIKMLITLSLTLCVLAVGSISVFATDATFPVLSSGEYRFNDMITKPVEFTDYSFSVFVDKHQPDYTYKKCKHT